MKSFGEGIGRKAAAFGGAVLAAAAVIFGAAGCQRESFSEESGTGAAASVSAYDASGEALSIVSGESSEGFSAAEGAQTVEIQLLCTSDLLGKYLPYDYEAGREDYSGSLAQISTAVREIRKENCVLIDAGDSTHGNFAEAFAGGELHPFAQAASAMGYDIWCLGERDFDSGLAALRGVMDQMDAETLCGNVYDGDLNRIAAPYAVKEIGGVRVGFIGMVSSNITRWNGDKLEGGIATSAVVETNAMITKLEDQCDVLVGIMHMGEESEYGVVGSGADDVAESCPGLDVIIAAHGHELVEGRTVNGVLIVENEEAGKSLIEINITAAADGKGGFGVAEKASRAVAVEGYEPDAEITELLSWTDAAVKEYAEGADAEGESQAADA